MKKLKMKKLGLSKSKVARLSTPAQLKATAKKMKSTIDAYARKIGG